MKVYYVYEWFNCDTGEVFYVGKGKGRRKNDLYKRNKFFLDYYNSHKCSNRVVKKNLTEEEAFAQEKQLILFYKTNTNFRLTNQTDGGEGVSKFGKENGMHKSNYTRPLEWRKKHSEFMKGNKNAKGCKRNSEYIKNLKERFSGKNNPLYGKNHSEETRRKMSINNYSKTEEGRERLKGSTNPNSKKITFIFSDGTQKTYGTLKEATEIMSAHMIRTLAKSKKPLNSKLEKFKHLNNTKVIMSK